MTPLTPLKAPNSTSCLKKITFHFWGDRGSPQGQPDGVGGMPGVLQLWSPLGREVPKDAHWCLFIDTEQEKGTAPLPVCASGTLGAASIRWALQRAQQGPFPVPALGRGRTVAGNPGCPRGCQRLSALPRRSAACRCVPERKGSLSAPLSAEGSSLQPPVSFPTPKPKPWNHRIVWVGNTSTITKPNCSPSSAKASTNPHPHGS